MSPEGRTADWHKVADDRAAEIIRLRGRVQDLERNLDVYRARVVALMEMKFPKPHAHCECRTCGHLDIRHAGVPACSYPGCKCDGWV